MFPQVAIYVQSLDDFKARRRDCIRMLLQKVPSNIDESAGSAVIGKFVDQRFGLLDEAFKSCGGGFAEAYYGIVSE